MISVVLTFITRVFDKQNLQNNLREIIFEQKDLTTAVVSIDMYFSIGNVKKIHYNTVC